METPHYLHRTHSIRTYVTGFLVSLVLTLAAFVLVNTYTHGAPLWLSKNLAVAGVLTLAILQLIAQLYFFLHLGYERSPRWYGFVFVFSFLIVLIIVIGSLWIMDNLMYNMMTPQETDAYMLDR
jgi:cytochrome o ubiquinol oxidase subunit IV